MKAAMLLVLTFFVALYAGAHYYIFRKALILFPSSQGLLLCVLSVLLLSPILAELSKRAGLIPVAVPLGWVGYVWMGFAFLFFSFPSRWTSSCFCRRRPQLGPSFWR